MDTLGPISPLPPSQSKRGLLSESRLAPFFRPFTCSSFAGGTSFPRGSKYPIFKLSGSENHTLLVFGTRVLKYWVLGPSGFSRALNDPPGSDLELRLRSQEHCLEDKPYTPRALSVTNPRAPPTHRAKINHHAGIQAQKSSPFWVWGPNA